LSSNRGRRILQRFFPFATRISQFFLRFAIRFEPQLYFVLLFAFGLPLKRGAHITLFFQFVNPYFHSVFTNFAELAFYSEEENCLLGEGANYRHPPIPLQAFFEVILKEFCRSAQQLNRCIAKRPIRRIYEQITPL
jgi:hypothetical protein